MTAIPRDQPITRNAAGLTSAPRVKDAARKLNVSLSNRDFRSARTALDNVTEGSEDRAGFHPAAAAGSAIRQGMIRRATIFLMHRGMGHLTILKMNAWVNRSKV